MEMEIIENYLTIVWKLNRYLPVKTSKIPKFLKSSFRSCCLTSSIEQLPSKSKVSNTFSTYCSLLNDVERMPCRFFFRGVTLKLWQTFSNIARLPKVWLWAMCWASFCSIHDDKGSWQASLEMTNYMLLTNMACYLLFTLAQSDFSEVLWQSVELISIKESFASYDNNRRVRQYLYWF